MIALIVSLYLTYKWGGIFWLPVPFLVMPLIGGIGGVAKGLYLKNTEKNKGDR